ncbi:protein ANTAGONIST OF LIKE HETEROCHROMATIN PROTEIN 1-like [Actinidia eriantha]|uniref:protein ANTAGONIST OF LIKE HETEROCHROMATIN PROTEIN 1-like n=1 Tax=Actinidia eriantha TaxID=165200 RepID=UPI00259121DA|nr:protein ANTAGONIST OF LIKE HETEROCHROMATIN PROTEIN 1-like [Actinidia eriantha]
MATFLITVSFRMARLNNKQLRRREEQEAVIAFTTFIQTVIGIFRLYLFILSMSRYSRPSFAQNPEYYQTQVNVVNRIVNGNEEDCHEQLRVNRFTFLRLCLLVRSVGLGDSRFVCVEERVAIFLWILGHHKKQRRTKFEFWRSIKTISRHFNAVLQAVLRLHKMLLVSPEPVRADDHDQGWSSFQNCLGALDGTFVPVNPPSTDMPWYRSRKGDLATNVLGVCTRDLQFVFVLSGWEGSATDSRILRDAIARPNGLKVTCGHYYLVDGGYTNGEGFLAPYHGERYHLNIWRQGHMPTSKDEYFNMKHSAARNVIERCFGVLKMRFAILRSPSYYPIQTQCRIVTACCLLHNLIKKEMPNDPVEFEYKRWEQENLHNIEVDDDHVTTIETSNEWTGERDALARAMYNHWLANGGGQEVYPP